MNKEMKISDDPDGRWIVRVGALSALLLGAGYLLTFPVITIAGGFPPPGIEERLAFFSEHAPGWWALVGLMVFTDLLYVPVFAALYHALKGIHKYMMVLAVVFEGLFVVLDLAVTWTAFPSMLVLSRSYAGAASDAQRAVIVAAAGYPSSINDSPLSSVYAVLFPAVGLLLTCLVMRRGIFGKPLAYLGVAAGACGILAGIGPIFFSDLETAQMLNASLAMIWFFWTGFKLYKLSRQI